MSKPLALLASQSRPAVQTCFHLSTTMKPYISFATGNGVAEEGGGGGRMGTLFLQVVVVRSPGLHNYFRPGMMYHK